MKRLLRVLFLGLFLPVQASWFGYDRAVIAARGGDTEQAAGLLSDELTSSPENPALLYDSGVLACKQQKYEQAEAFFSKTVGYTSSDNQLHRQALFNLGNAHVGATKLHEALEAYNQLLVLEPQHEKARHNRDVVKKMLEQQDSQESQTQNDKKQNQENNKQQSGQQNQDQKNNQQGKSKSDADNKQQSGQQQGNQQQNSGQQQSGSQEYGSQGDKQQKQKSSRPDNQQESSENNSSTESQAEQENQTCDKRQQQKSSEKGAARNGQQSSEEKSNNQQSSDGDSRNQDNQKRDGKDNEQLDERDGYKERYGKRDNDANGKDEQQPGSDQSEAMNNKADDKEGCDDQRTQQHDDSPSRARGAHKNVTTSKTMKVGSKAQESAKKETKKQYAAWAEAMLDAVQLNDETLNKVLVQKAVAGNLGGRDGECCW